MTINRIKIIAIAIMALPLLFVAVANMNTTKVRAVSSDDEQTVATYKAKCNACHGPAAAKAYNPDMPLEEQVDAILKGKKGEKPPYMPGFETKGITAEQAKELAEYMKKLRTPAGE